MPACPRGCRPDRLMPPATATRGSRSPLPCGRTSRPRGGRCTSVTGKEREGTTARHEGEMQEEIYEGALHVWLVNQP